MVFFHIRGYCQHETTCYYSKTSFGLDSSRSSTRREFPINLQTERSYTSRPITDIYQKKLLHQDRLLLTLFPEWVSILLPLPCMRVAEQWLVTDIATGTIGNKILLDSRALYGKVFKFAYDSNYNRIGLYKINNKTVDVISDATNRMTYFDFIIEDQELYILEKTSQKTSIAYKPL